MYLNNTIPCWPDVGLVTAETCSQMYPVPIIQLLVYVIISVIKVHSTSFSNGIPLEKLVECTLITLFLVGLMMAG